MIGLIGNQENRSFNSHISMQLKWGILSAGRISNDFVAALKTLPKEHHQVVAVAARESKSAEEFAKLHSIPKFYGGYENLLTDEEVQIVYIGVTNPQHYECVKQCLKHKKHVLCEKPFGINSREVEEMIAIARASKLFLMEAVWSRFLPSVVALREELSKGTIGDIHHIHCQFGLHRSQSSPRLTQLELGGGSLLDIGVYAVNLTSMVMGGKRPDRIHGSGTKNENGVDVKAFFTLDYPGKVFAQLSCSVCVKLSNTLTIYGENGYLRLPAPFHASGKLETSEGVREFPFPPSDAKYNFVNSVALCFEADHCRDCIVQDKTESPVLPLDESLLVTNILDEVRKQLGVVFPQDT